MSNIRFFFNNLVDSASLLESTQSTGFPVENIQHPFRTKIWKTNGTKGNVVFNFGAAVGVRSVVLANHSWMVAPSTLEVNFGSSSAFTAGVASTQVLTWAARPTTHGNEACIVKTFTTQTKQFAKLKVGSSSSWSLGRVHLGGYFEPTLERLADSEQEFVDLSYVEMTADGQRHADEISLTRRKRFSFVVATQAQWEEFQRAFNKVRTTKDFFIAFSTEQANEMTWYGHFAEMPKMARIPGVGFSIDCEFEEAK